MEDNTILQRIGIIQHEILPIVKKTDGFNYKYANEVEVAEHLKPLLIKYHLAVVPYKTEEFNVLNNGTRFMFRQQIRVVDTENGHYETFYQIFGNNLNGKDNIAQKIGGAITYGMRYFMLKTFYIPSFDKDDPDYAEGEKARKQATKTPNRSLKKEGVKADEFTW